MAIQHGVNFTASDMAQLVQQGSDASGKKSWETLYGNAGLNYQAQSDALLKSYGDTIAEAYKASLQQQNALYDFGLSANDTHDLRNIARQDLMTTYQNYLANYQQAQQNIADTYTEQKGLYDEALMTESENFANLYNYAMDYYENVLKNATYTYTDTSKPIYEDESKEAVNTGKYEQVTTSLIDDYGLTWLMKKDTDNTLVPLERQELMNKLFDTEGVITDYGRNFYDMIFNNAFYTENYTDTQGNPIVSFDKWLSDNDNDLYNWLKSEDTFNYTRQGTKLGTAKTWLGLESDDETFKSYQMVDSLLGESQTTLHTINDFFTNNEDIQNINRNYEKHLEGLDELLTASLPKAGEIANFARYTKNSYDTYRDTVKGFIQDFINKDYETFITALESNIDADIYNLYSKELETLISDTMDKFNVVIDIPELSYDYQTYDNLRDEDIEAYKQFSEGIQNLYNSIKNIPQEFYKKLNEITKKMYAEQNKHNSNVSGR